MKMDRFMSILSILLVAVCLSSGNVIPQNVTCNPEEITETLNNIKDLINKMDAPDADVEALDKQVKDAIENTPDDFSSRMPDCQAVDEALETLMKFYKDMTTMTDILDALVIKDLTKAKEIIESFDEEFFLRLFVYRFGYDSDGVIKIIEVIKILDNQQFANVMKKSIINDINVRDIKLPEDQMQYLNENKNEVED